MSAQFIFKYRQVHTIALSDIKRDAFFKSYISGVKSRE